MGIEALQQRPDRVTIGNLETGDTISAQFNPDEVKEELVVNFAKLEILGLSHKPMQYQNTENLVLNFDLAFDQLSHVEGHGVELSGGLTGSGDPQLARRFLHSLCYAPRGAQDVSGGGPPRALLHWPNLFSLTCRIGKLSISHKRFRLDMTPVYFVASLMLEEARDVRLYSEDVFDNGTLR